MPTSDTPVISTKLQAPPPYAIVAADLIRTGGMDRANLALARYLLSTGHDVHAVSHRADEELLAQPNFTFHRVRKPLNSYLAAGPLLARAGNRVARQIAAQGGRVVVNGGNCSFGDINWVHYVHAAYTPTAVHNPARRLKTACAQQVYLAAEAKCLHSARVIISNSDRTRQDLIDRLGLPSERIHTVYYGNDAKAFSPPSPEERSEIRRALQWASDRPVALFIGALGDRRKGFDTLFSAWLKLCGRPSWDANLVVIGTGGELLAWKQRAADANLASRISFLGFRRDVPKLVRGADVLIAPTRYEAYGLGVQEALCCGLPALVGAGAGVAERYPAKLKSLLLPDCEDVGDLISRLVAWRENAEQLRETITSAFEPMRLRSWDEMAKEIVTASDTVRFDEALARE
jgi:glycosyltransferase involved in cell wall biosynthesis